MSTDVTIRECTSKADLKRFAAVARNLYQRVEGYQPALDLIEFQNIDPGFNPYFKHAASAFWIAYKDGRAVGRIGAQVDTLDAEMGRKGMGHFGSLAAGNDPALVAQLFGVAHQWLKARGVTEVTGPFNMSINAESGMLVGGFTERPMFLIPWDPPWLGPLVEKAGYAKAVDLYSYDYPQLSKPISAARRMIDRGLDSRITVRLANMKKIGRETTIVRDVFNDAWRDNWGFVPYTEAEINHLAKELKPFLLDECVSIVEVDGEPVAFALALPNLMELFAGCNGKLLPAGWFTVLSRWMKGNYRTARVALMGVRKKYKDTALGASLALLAIEKLREGAARHGLESAELGWVLDTNQPMRRMLELLGARPYKTHRVYSRSLTS
ncbi:MAG: dATP pyrophosphohydrolase [Hyphomicrobiales bacterium]